jgi:hypothetical protein
MNATDHAGQWQEDEANMDFSTREAFAVREFCAVYGICRQTFYDEIKRGRIRARKLGAKTMILKSEAERWAKSLPELRIVEQATAERSKSVVAERETAA